MGINTVAESSIRVGLPKSLCYLSHKPPHATPTPTGVTGEFSNILMQVLVSYLVFFPWNFRFSVDQMPFGKESGWVRLRLCLLYTHTGKAREIVAISGEGVGMRE